MLVWPTRMSELTLCILRLLLLSLAVSLTSLFFRNFKILSCHLFFSSAKVMVKSALAKNPKFAVYFNLEGWMLANLTAGMSPVSSLGDAMTQVAFSGVFRIISLFVLNDWWRIIQKFRAESKKVD